jgi:hypothetical protein
VVEGLHEPTAGVQLEAKLRPLVVVEEARVSLFAIKQPFSPSFAVRRSLSPIVSGSGSALAASGCNQPARRGYEPRLNMCDHPMSLLEAVGQHHSSLFATPRHGPFLNHDMRQLNLAGSYT